jgi:hypothetical protein
VVSFCIADLSTSAFASRSQWNYSTFKQWLMDQEWTPESAARWQELFNNAPRFAFAGRAGNFVIETLPKIPVYKDLKVEECKGIDPDTTTATTSKPVTSTRSEAMHHFPYVCLTLIALFIALFHQ